LMLISAGVGAAVCAGWAQTTTEARTVRTLKTEARWFMDFII
jgi:hypothetical protein